MEWDYGNHPQCSLMLPKRTDELLRKLQNGSLDIRSSLIDTRPIHQHLFGDLTPYGHEYFAGHYRGESFSFLQGYQVEIQNRPHIGESAHLVPQAMSAFGRSIGKGLDNLDMLHQSNSSSAGDKLRTTIRFACAAFVKFTQIHPYANGNGHIGRVMLTASLKKYRYNTIGWSIEPRPADPRYISLVRLYEAGDQEPLYQWIMSLLDFP